jgi:hypothetical protein
MSGHVSHYEARISLSSPRDAGGGHRQSRGLLPKPSGIQLRLERRIGRDRRSFEGRLPKTPDQRRISRAVPQLCACIDLAQSVKIISPPESKTRGLHEFTAADLDGNLLRVFYDFAAAERA